MAQEERAHALLSASSAHRWLNCTPSAKLEEQFPDTSSEAAQEGTIAHELAELKVRHYFHPVDFGRQKFTRRVNKLKKEELWQNEMDGYTEEYLDYIKVLANGLASKPGAVIEQKFYYDAWAPGGFGTADCILIHGDTIHIIDFKYGKGVPVSAEKNPQMMLYALGAYDTYKLLYPIQNIKMTIIQPRLDSVSEWGCTLEELLEFGKYVKERAVLAIDGKGDFAPDVSTCRFCRAKAQCRARSDYNVKQAFDLGELPPLITHAEAGERLARLADVAKYQKDLQEWALAECLAGNEVPGWKAVEGRGSRDWIDMDKAFEALQASGTPEALLWEKKPLTLAQIEKMLGKKEFDTCVGSMVVKNPGKPALVKESDKRDAITNKITAAEAFKEGE
ncbi:DUF2800 domain-containing protein [Bariatricus massiliensis]|uniref:DUF2800 domain-containing protein n=1 Tax=Bariatricus massiliensis TaxID=1745713 RepID=A0ABS8DHD9_9FIRM|nr:DUF2800 domain-containing protein [Bariatricus massiliensis]PWM14408.1 MAG: DUF2800 domain-containing protein [Collinsella tanakaei]MCB7304831.1 DUF2800 domain-containing protein [Bariatricus massiliensis]MCB7375385.1 DUF2800 domain-containing protein [Bariatricus massiliensis]MCB7387845.1 DUF2800 domain-containing protein [Bariatricus massiliensis]MCB7412066.1 DUF2800 domain-containing protein [Bariatricus massiliensis]